LIISLAFNILLSNVLLIEEVSTSIARDFFINSILTSSFFGSQFKFLGYLSPEIFISLSLEFILINSFKAIEVPIVSPSGFK
jgi:hypoxanthine-guanine phosphoribosyltransferase